MLVFEVSWKQILILNNLNIWKIIIYIILTTWGQIHEACLVQVKIYPKYRLNTKGYYYEAVFN